MKIESRSRLGIGARIVAALLFSGILHATPIANLEAPARDTQHLAHAAAVSMGMKISGVSAAVPVPSTSLITRAPEATCLPGGGCYKAVQVPEPQSLLMVGTGLLSMAGLIRRRLLRS